MEQQPPRDSSIFVSNISPSATEKSVADFFSFCGIITSITIRPTPDAQGVQEAIVEFEHEAATKTALLLTNALIVDRPITVVRYNAQTHTAESADKSKEKTFSKDEIPNKEHQVPASQRTQTSVIASLLAAGYKLGTDTLKSAREYDEAHSISANVKSTAEKINASVTKFDKDYKISETANAWTNAAIEKLTEVDQQLGVTTTVDALNKKAETVIKQVNDSDPVQVTVGVIQSTAAAVVGIAEGASRAVTSNESVKTATEKVKSTTEAVQKEIENVIRETTELIDEQSGEEKKEEEKKESVEVPKEEVKSATPASEEKKEEQPAEAKKD